MTTPTPLYFKGTLLTSDDYPNIAEDFRIPFGAVESAVEQIRTKGEPLYSLFPSSIRENVRRFAAEVSLAPEPDTLVVDGTQKVSESASAPIVAHSEGDTPKSPPAASQKAKKAKPVEKVFRLVDEDAESTDPAPLAVQDEVVEGATNALIQAMTMGEGHFIITPDGHCTINRESPPTLTHAYQTVEASLKLDQLGEKVTDAAAWLQGDLIMELEDFFGEEFSVSQVCDINSAAYNTLATRLSVCKAFKGKRYKLPFTHHKEAFHAKISSDPETNRDYQKLILHKAETYDLSAKNIRSLCSIAKTMEDDTTIRLIRSTQQARDLIDAYKQARVSYVVFTEGTWIRVTGLGDKLPMASETEHFPVMLDLKNWKAYADGKVMSDIPKRGARG